jgi:orotidine-5'-phosphate decarboxylase
MTEIICALDTKDVNEAVALTNQLKGKVGAVKLGLEYFTANGPEGIRQVTKTGVPVFLDLKFHDIPNTVAGAVSAAVALDVFMLTIHTTGGKAMMEAAVQAAKTTAKSLGKKPPLIMGVTILTSMDQSDLDRIGVFSPISTQVLKLAMLAEEAGLDGVVCSPLEIEMLKDELGKFKLVVPGIRPKGSNKGDQKRVMTPGEAASLGADYLVIGRPITESQEPAKAALAIAEELKVKQDVA